jgi:hypothetical protein
MLHVIQITEDRACVDYASKLGNGQMPVVLASPGRFFGRLRHARDDRGTGQAGN